VISDLFVIRADTGEIVLLRPAAELPATVYTLGVMAEDRGDNPIASMVSVTVSVTDINQHAPVIAIDGGSSTATSRGENNPIVSERTAAEMIGGGELHRVNAWSNAPGRPNLNDETNSDANVETKTYFDAKKNASKTHVGGTSSTVHEHTTAIPAWRKTTFINATKKDQSYLHGVPANYANSEVKAADVYVTRQDDVIVELTEHGPPNASVALVSVTDADRGVNGHVRCSLVGPSAKDFSLVQLYEFEYQILAARSFDNSQRKVRNNWKGGVLKMYDI